jgi:hypothetical protein
MQANPEMQSRYPRKHQGLKAWMAVLFWLYFTTACRPLPEVLPSIRVQLADTPTPFQPLPWTLTPSPIPATPTPTLPPYSLWIDPRLPQSFQDQIELPVELGISSQPQGASLRLEIGASQLVSAWVYALVAPFPTVTDGLSADELHQAWKGKARGDFKGIPLMMAESTRVVFSAMWGEPAEDAVAVRPADELLQAAWDQRPSWAIIPFEDLEPQWKVLEVQGLSPLHSDFNPGAYPLTVPISISGEAAVRPLIPPGNRDPQKMTTLVMTGVTALVRATAFTMEQKGVIYPAKDIRDWLQEADITHISNEVPFAEDCPYPNPVQEGMKFCSNQRYIELLDDVGTDIVELTGDHFSDWGSEAMLFTLELYDQRSWPYYGGGTNLKEGRQAVTLTHNGNRLAFIGCNAKGGGYARASATQPGAAACDFEGMRSEIKRLRADGYLVIATFQHFEYYTYAAQPNQIRDAHQLTEVGAVIVSGSQAHQPQAFEFSNGSLVHHGLGNLFFDQLDVSTATRQGFIDRHVFYEGRHISTELLTIWFMDYARPRPMTAPERESLLTAVFQASGW